MTGEIETSRVEHHAQELTVHAKRHMCGFREYGATTAGAVRYGLSDENGHFRGEPTRQPVGRRAFDRCDPCDGGNPAPWSRNAPWRGMARHGCRICPGGAPGADRI